MGGFAFSLNESGIFQVKTGLFVMFPSVTNPSPFLLMIFFLLSFICVRNKCGTITNPANNATRMGHNRNANFQIPLLAASL